MSFQKAIEDGYSNAMRAILDANITTLLVAVILYAYGTGPIKGFAITISIGILASMLTAILGTHGIYEALMPKLSKDKDSKNGLELNNGIFSTNKVYDFMGRRLPFRFIFNFSYCFNYFTFYKRFKFWY